MNNEWRLSKRKRLQNQEVIHRYCSPLQLHWKDINFDVYGQSREEQQLKALATFRQTIEKQNVQFDAFRIQLQQKFNDIDATLNKIQSTPRQTMQPDIVVQKSKSKPNTPVPSRRPSILVSGEQLTAPQLGSTAMTTNDQMMVFDEIARIRELLEETVLGQTDRNTSPVRLLPGSISSATTNRRSTTIAPTRQHLRTDTHASLPVRMESQIQPYSQDLGERVTDLQLAVNRLHQDVSAIRQVVERMSPLSASLILGRTAGLK